MSFFLRAAVEGADHCASRLEWPMDASGLDVREGQRQLPVDFGIGTQGDFVALHLGLQEIADAYARLVADCGGEGDLILCFDFD